MAGAAPPSSPPAAAPASPPTSKAEILTNVCTLAAQFSSCVEVFNLIHPSKQTSRAQRVALAKLGIQQGRLLIWGDAVGIYAPPRTVARYMIPSQPAPTNPDPTMPVPFAPRDPRLDEPHTYEKVRAALNQIAGRPSYLTREELMAKYGLKSPKRFGPGAIEYPALDTNRLESFREKYALLQDLARQEGERPQGKRGLSMTTQRWIVHDVDRFSNFVNTIKKEVDGLVELMGVKEQVDRGMKSDIRTLGWHPDLSRQAIRHDWEKLRLIREACREDYPEYMEATEAALKYIGEELRERGEQMRSASVPPSVHSAMAAAAARDKARFREDEEQEKRRAAQEKEKATHKEKRPGFLSLFKFRSWSRSSDKIPQRGTRSTPTTPGPGPRLADEGSEEEDSQQRSKSLDFTAIQSQKQHDSAGEELEPEPEYQLQPARSKSMSAVPDEPTTWRSVDDLFPHLEEVPTVREEDRVSLTPANTANSLIERHDMFKGPGRVETRDIRAKAHDWAEGG